MGQLMAGYMDGTINVWKTEFNAESSAKKLSKSLARKDKIKVKHIMEMTMSSHILKLELVKAEPFDMLLILGSDFQITVFALLPKKPKKVAILGSKYPIVDFKVVELPSEANSKFLNGFGAHEVYHNRKNLRQDMGGFRLLAIDNRTNVIEFGILKPGGPDHLPKYGFVNQIKANKRYKTENINNRKVEIEQFFGSSPKSELFLTHNKFGKSIVMKDQKSKALII